MTIRTVFRRRYTPAAALACILAIAGCSSGDRERAGQMTSYASRASASETPRLFTIPDDQMSHVQVVTVQPTTLVRTLRLTGTVAYNAFNTTPVITQVGGPVTRILSVPGQHVHEGEPMLEVSSPDYSQLLDTYLKAADSSRLTETNYARAQDL
jgi:cobalt-zinc-cadmium efflux system membrane fusion protein